MVGDQADKELKMTIWNHLNASASIPFFILMSLLMIFLFGATKPTFIGLAIWLGVNIIPTLFLHIDYFIVNRGESYKISFDKLVRYKFGERKEFKINEIDYIELFMSPAVFRGSNIHFLGMEAYHYAEINLKSGDKLYLTCLLTTKIEKSVRQLKGVQVRRKKRIYNPIN